MPNPAPTLIALPLAYLSDADITKNNARYIIPVNLDFSQNVQEDIGGVFNTSALQIATASVKGVTILSAIKGLCITYKVYSNHVLKIFCQETNQAWYLGVPANMAGGNNYFIINARLPMFLPNPSTLVFTNYSLVSDPPSTDFATIQLTNFEVVYALEVVANPFNTNI